MPPITEPTPKDSLQNAISTYFQWGSFSFQLVGNNTFRPGTPAATEKEVVAQKKTYKTYTPKSGFDPMGLTLIYDPTIWAALLVHKEAGTVNTLESSDGFSKPAMISQLQEVKAEVDGPISEMQLTFGFPSGTGTGTGTGT